MFETENELTEKLASNLGKVADAITPFISCPGQDASGSYVSSLTEAVMGNTAGLMAIANAINNFADALRGD